MRVRYPFRDGTLSERWIFGYESGLITRWESHQNHCFYCTAPGKDKPTQEKLLLFALFCLIIRHLLLTCNSHFESLLYNCTFTNKVQLLPQGFYYKWVLSKHDFHSFLSTEKHDEMQTEIVWKTPGYSFNEAPSLQEPSLTEYDSGYILG